MLSRLVVLTLMLLVAQSAAAAGYTATCYWGAQFNSLGEHYDLIEQQSNHSCHPSDLDAFETAYTADCAIGYGQYGPVIGGVMSKAGDTTFYVSSITCIKPPQSYRPWQEPTKPQQPRRSAESFFAGVFTDIHFGLNAARIDPTMKAELKELALFVRGAPTTRVVVSGHTDALGTADYNQRLSKKRAASVADYLQWLGITRDRMIVAGYGEARPLASNETVEGRRRNRRVEIQVVETN